MTQLPLGQIRPAAQPVNAFFQPGKANVAAATAQPGVPRTPQISTIQERGGINVQGFNSFQQLAESLEPFIKESLTLGQNMALDYVKNQVNEGMRKEAKNQLALASVNLQTDMENGAREAATETVQLYREDPEAGELLRMSNPYQEVGARRVRALSLKGEIQSAVMSRLQTDAARLSLIKPGSPELAKEKSDIIRGLYAQYGMTGDEPEAMKYVTPKVNTVWDKFTEQHQKLYAEQVEVTATNGAVSNVLAEMKNFAARGIEFSDMTYTKGMPGFGMVGGMKLTEIIDRHTSLIASPKARASLIKKIRQELLGVAKTPYEQQLIQNIRIGNPNVPYGQRPTLYDAAPFTSSEQMVEGMELRQRRAAFDVYQDPESPYMGYVDQNGNPQQGVGQLMPTDPRYPAAIQELEDYLEQNNVPGAEKVLTDVLKQRGDLIKTIEPARVGAAEIKSAEFGAMPAENFAPGQIADRMQEAKQYAQENANDPQKQQELFDKQKAVINQRAQEYKNIVTNVTPAVESSLSVFYGDEAVKSILKPTGVTSLKQKLAELGTGNYQQALSQFETEADVRRMVLQVNNDMREVARAAILQADPDSDLRAVGQAAILDYLDGPKFQTRLEPFRPKPVPPPPKPGTMPAEAKNLSDAQVMDYPNNPTMRGEWVVQELKNRGEAGDSSGYSQEFVDLARRSKVSPARLLYEHIDRHYSHFDPNSKYRIILRQDIKRQKEAQTVSYNQPLFDYDGYKVTDKPINTSKPGGWLAGMLFAGYMTPDDRKMLRDYAEQMRRLKTPAAIEEIRKMNIRYRNYGMHFPLA